MSNPLEQAGRERREHARQRVSRVEVRVASQDSFRDSYLRDLSLGGLFVRTTQLLAPGTAVLVELSVEGQPAVQLRGEVIRQEHAPEGTPLGMGLRFFREDPATRDALQQLIHARLRPSRPLAGAPPPVLEAQLDPAESERKLLANLALELQQRVKTLEDERNRLFSDLQVLKARAAHDEEEKGMLREATVRLSNELETVQHTEEVSLDDEPLQWGPPGRPAASPAEPSQAPRAPLPR